VATLPNRRLRAPIPKVLADIVVVGYAPRGKAVRRSGLRPATRSTSPEGSEARRLPGIAFCAAEEEAQSRKVSRALLSPARLAVGKYLRERGIATSMIDLSDGLSNRPASSLRRESGRAEVAAEMIPRAHGATLEHALHGGEDYELLSQH